MIALNEIPLHGADKHDSTVCKITKGTYQGDGTNNKAIAHGLGKIPKIIHLIKIGYQDNLILVNMDSNLGTWVNAIDSTIDGVPAATATDFYVSAGLSNITGKTYYWVALG